MNEQRNIMTSSLERGAGLAEYGLLLLIVLVACLAAMGALAGAVIAAYNTASGIFN